MEVLGGRGQAESWFQVSSVLGESWPVTEVSMKLGTGHLRMTRTLNC
jgi:hypothetical protein